MRRELVILLMVLVGCTRTELPDYTGQPIRFCADGCGAQVVTRAISTDPDDASYLIADGNTVGLYGGWAESDDNSITEIFNKTLLTCEEYESAKFRWYYSPLRYWRKHGVYEFRAVYPSSVKCQYGTNGRRLITNYSMHTDDQDLMVASKKVSITSGEVITDSVKLQFHHATAAIRFLFQKGEGVQTNYKLNSFELQNLHTVAVLMYQGDNITVDSWNPSEFLTHRILPWNATTPDDRVDIPEKYEDFTEERWHYVIPQRLTSKDSGSAAAVRFSLTVNDSDTPIYTTLALPQTYKDEFNVTHDVVWEPGKKYNYYIHIQPSKVTIKMTVTPWDSFFVAVDDVIFGD